VINKHGNADEAKADEANEAEADEANKAEDNEVDAKANDAAEAIATEVIEANVIDKIVAADDAIVISDEAILDDAANEAIVVDAANYAIVADDADGAVLYSFTKYYAIFAEVKGYFGVTAPDNQLERRSSCSLRSKN
jgi:hypothetical protein